MHVFFPPFLKELVGLTCQELCIHMMLPHLRTSLLELKAAFLHKNVDRHVLKRNNFQLRKMS